jgi:hypothetical protein
MSLSITAKFPGGNVTGVEVRTRDGLPEIRFASDPCGGAESLWFYFRIEESAPDPAKHTKIRITWTMMDSIYGGAGSPVCIPVTSSPGSTWMRLKQGEENRNEDGLRELSWQIPHPSPSTEIAFCFPYGPAELDNAIERSRDFWKIAPIGISQGGRTIKRVYHQGGAGGNYPAIFIVARQHGGETPASWVLDGLLRHLAASKKAGYTIWTVPLADIDGAEWGWYGRENIPHDLGHAWNDPPTRHEALVIGQDILRWKSAGKPLLVLDLQATAAFEKDGVYALSCGGAEETKWCNVMKNELRDDYAAADFVRTADRPSRSSGNTLIQWARQIHNLPAISLHIPYAQCAGNILTQKSYREIGQRLALAIMRRNG